MSTHAIQLSHAEYHVEAIRAAAPCAFGPGPFDEDREFSFRRPGERSGHSFRCVGLEHETWYCAIDRILQRIAIADVEPVPRSDQLGWSRHQMTFPFSLLPSPFSL